MRMRTSSLGSYSSSADSRRKRIWKRNGKCFLWRRGDNEISWKIHNIQRRPQHKLGMGPTIVKTVAKFCCQL